MKILIPLEVPDGTYDLLIGGEAESNEEIKIIEYEYNAEDLLELAQLAKILEGSLIRTDLPYQGTLIARENLRLS